jgi:hypothetical protein
MSPVPHALGLEENLRKDSHTVRRKLRRPEVDGYPLMVLTAFPSFDGQIFRQKLD